MSLCLVVTAGCTTEQRSTSRDMTPQEEEPPCAIAACANGVASTCPVRDVFLDCNSFGGLCADFESTSQSPFRWCDCGALAEGEGQCLDGKNAVICEQGMGVPASCVTGTICVADGSGPNGLGCQCDDLDDGICPDPACVNDPDCASCTPSCGGRVCGDNGCNGSCGSCGVGQTCSNGQCVASCVPSCVGKTCGDDGCNGSCGSCRADQTCTSGACVDNCKPACDGKTCGDDGCNGSCGHCGIGQTCSAAGTCEGATCTPNCTGYVCGSDGCSGSCGSCPSDLTCKLDGTACECDFFATLTYTFDASAIDFTDLYGIDVQVEHVNLDGSLGASSSFFLSSPTPKTKKLTVYGCRPKVNVRYTFFAKNGTQCDLAKTTVAGQTTIPTPPTCFDAPPPPDMAAPADLRAPSDLATSSPDLSKVNVDMAVNPFGPGVKIHYSGTPAPNAMALDVSSGIPILFYANDDGTMRVLVDPPYGTNAGAVFTTGDSHVTKMATNNKYLFWSSWDSASNMGGIRRASTSGWPQTLPAPIVTGNVYGLAASDTHVFWVDSAGIHRMPAAGGAASLIVSGSEFNDIVVHGSSIYYSDNLGGTIGKANLDGTSPTPFVTGESQVSNLGAGESNLVWTNASDKEVRAKSYAGGSAVTVATTTGYPLSVVTDDTSVFWVESNNHIIQRAPITGAGPTVGFTSETGDHPFHLLIDSTSSVGPTLYWDKASGLSPYYVASKQIP